MTDPRLPVDDPALAGHEPASRLDDSTLAGREPTSRVHDPSLAVEEAFPGAHSQVPRAHTPPTRPPAESVFGSGTLPLEATPVRANGGWLLRLPVRAEEVTVRKQAVVRERVVIRRRAVDEVRSVEEVVRRERLRVDDEDLPRHPGASPTAATEARRY